MPHSDLPTAQEYVPAHRSLPALAAAIPECKGCDLYRNATQAVFGEGPKNAKIVFVGEQPGDQEDLKGKPFVGPAGHLWNKALEAAGLIRSEVYVTNAVKHFKFEERGKRRLHKKPRASEVTACRPWLNAEIETVNPEIIVAMGATAAMSVAGREFAIQKERGKFIPLPGGRKLLITVHPSFLLRLRDDDREAEFARLCRRFAIASLTLLKLVKQLDAHIAVIIAQCHGRSLGAKVPLHAHDLRITLRYVCNVCER